MLSTSVNSGVLIALLITRTTFNVSCFRGTIMVIDTIALSGILLLDVTRNSAASASPQKVPGSKRADDACAPS